MKTNMTRPDYRLVELPGAQLEVELKCDPSFFCVFEEGYRAEWYDYDYTEKRVTVSHITRCLGKIRIRGEECFEFHSDEYSEAGNWKRSLQSYYAFREDGIHCIRWVWRYPDEPAFEEEIEGYVLPYRLHVGFQKEREQEIHRRGAEVWDEGGCIQKVTGAVLVDFGARQFRCLRYLLDGPPDTTAIAEMLIEEGGRVVLFRRYNGEGWWYFNGKERINFDQLKNCPQRQFEGKPKPFYLWYDCVPDYAFS